ncbi:MAG: cysteine desulfurase family protein [Alphaproteobacteria bacterium]
MHYLDYNATAPLRPAAMAAMLAAMDACGNASSVHAAGRRARAAIEDARAKVAALAGADSGSVIFTSGGTEANAAALKGAVAGAAKNNPITRLIISAIEHDSVRATARASVESMPSMELVEILVDANGVVRMDALRQALRAGKGRALVSVMAANNETGVVQPVEDAAALTKEFGALLHVDAVQAAGRLPLAFAMLGADYMTLSAHKLGGPQGAGALIVRESAPFAPLISGGGQEFKRRAGTENVAAIAGFAAAASEARDAAGENSLLASLRDRFEMKLKALAPHATVFGERAQRLVNTSNFAIPGLAAETAIIALDLDGVAVSSGAACSSGKVDRSHVLTAMGVSDELSRCGLRVSFGWSSTDADVEAALASLKTPLERRGIALAAA